MLKVIGLNILQRNMLARKRRLENTRKFHAQGVALVDRWIQDNFATEGKKAMGGSGWRPLSPTTLAMRRMRGKGAKILQDTGALRSRWKHLWDEKLGKVQSGVDYGEQHDKGFYGLPVRRILPLDRQVQPELKKLLEHFVKEGIR